MDSLFCTGIEMRKHGMETYEFTCQEKVQNPAFSGKTILTVFWDAKGPVSVIFRRPADKNSTFYFNMLINKEKPAVMRKPPGLSH